MRSRDYVRSEAALARLSARQSGSPADQCPLDGGRAWAGNLRRTTKAAGTSGLGFARWFDARSPVATQDGWLEVVAPPELLDQGTRPRLGSCGLRLRRLRHQRNTALIGERDVPHDQHPADSSSSHDHTSLFRACDLVRLSGEGRVQPLCPRRRRGQEAIQTRLSSSFSSRRETCTFDDRDSRVMLAAEHGVGHAEADRHGDLAPDEAVELLARLAPVSVLQIDAVRSAWFRATGVALEEDAALRLRRALSFPGQFATALRRCWRCSLLAPISRVQMTSAAAAAPIPASFHLKLLANTGAVGTAASVCEATLTGTAPSCLDRSSGRTDCGARSCWAIARETTSGTDE